MSDSPERFGSLAHAREWFDAFIAYCNPEHQHSGIGRHALVSVHFGTAEEVRTSLRSPTDEAESPPGSHTYRPGGVSGYFSSELSDVPELMHKASDLGK